MAEVHRHEPVPVFVGDVPEVDELRDPDDVDDTVDAAERRGGVREHALDLVAVRRVAAPRDAVDLLRDVLREAVVDVDAEHARAGTRERVRGLSADALTRADEDEAAAVEPEQ